MKLPDFFIKSLSEKLFDCYNAGYEDCRNGKDKILKEEFIKKFNNVVKLFK